MWLNFHASNNETKYETFLIRLKVARNVSAFKVIIYSAASDLLGQWVIFNSGGMLNEICDGI